MHTPLISRTDLRDKYLARKKERGLEAKWGKEHNWQVRSQEHAVYGGMVEAMDLAVGKVLDGLKEHAGGQHRCVFHERQRRPFYQRKYPTSNLLRGGKGWMYEGGIRELNDGPLARCHQARQRERHPRHQHGLFPDHHGNAGLAAAAPAH